MIREYAQRRGRGHLFAGLPSAGIRTLHHPRDESLHHIPLAAYVLLVHQYPQEYCSTFLGVSQCRLEGS